MAPPDMLDVIGEIHDAALDPELWARVVAKLAALVDAGSGTFYFIEKDTGRLDVLGSFGFDGAAYGPYCVGCRRVSLITEALFRQPPGLCFVGQQLVDQQTFEQSEIFTDFFRPLGICHTVGGLPLVNDGIAAVIGCQRPKDREPFEQQEANTLGLLFPHLAQAARVHSRMTQMHARIGALESIYDHWPTGVILTAADGLVLWCNERAEKMLASNDGLGTCNQRLTAAHPSTNHDLRDLLRRAAAFDREQQPGGHVVVPRPSHAEPYSLLVAPRPPQNGSPFGILNRPLAVVFVSDPASAVRTPVEALQSLHGLTPAEARLAEALMAGNCVREAAGLLEITECTARTYLKRVFHKTGACRQSDLVRIVLSGLAPMFHTSVGS